MTRPEGKWALFVGATRFVLSAFWRSCPPTVFLSTREIAAHPSRRYRQMRHKNQAHNYRNSQPDHPFLRACSDENSCATVARPCLIFHSGWYRSQNGSIKSLLRSVIQYYIYSHERSSYSKLLPWPAKCQSQILSFHESHVGVLQY